MKKINFIVLLLILNSIFTAFADNRMYGGRTEKSIQRVLEPLTGPVFDLFKKELAINSKYRGKADFKINILSSGNVEGCRADVSEIFVEELASKICDLIKDLNFGEGEEFELAYPINFYPE